MTNGEDFLQAAVFIQDRIIRPGHPQHFAIASAILTFTAAKPLRMLSNIVHQVFHTLPGLLNIPDNRTEQGFSDQFLFRKSE